MRIIGLVGLPGSGKSEAATVAEDAGVPVVTMGDVIRAVCRERDLELTEGTMGEVATDLREQGGDDAIADRSLPLIEDALGDADTVLVDGIRGQAEVDRFEAAFGDDFVLVSIDAPFETRLERIRERGRDPSADAREDLQTRDERERGYGMDRAMDDADLVVSNTDSLDAFHDRVRTLLTDGPAALDDDPAVTAP
jgi:dephospho-CoA kinase